MFTCSAAAHAAGGRGRLPGQTPVLGAPLLLGPTGPPHAQPRAQVDVQTPATCTLRLRQNFTSVLDGDALSQGEQVFLPSHVIIIN